MARSDGKAVKYHGKMDDKNWKNTEFGDKGSKRAQSYAAEEGWEDTDPNDPNAFYARKRKFLERGHKFCENCGHRFAKGEPMWEGHGFDQGQIRCKKCVGG